MKRRRAARARVLRTKLPGAAAPAPDADVCEFCGAPLEQGEVVAIGIGQHLPGCPAAPSPV